ncbi:hypothetical protein [Cerasicoccus frondis]|uniref:hypothetical protein n=1 Tax=Cerasicoccus frondis TaxID=490090 RepID=UPI002852B42A|nr:hypothetical protein [Cerasicoccus frondis]
MEVSGEGSANDLATIVDGDLETSCDSVLTEESSGKGFLRFGFDQPYAIQSIRYLARPIKDVGKENDMTFFKLSLIPESGEEEHVAYEGNFHGAKPRVSFIATHAEGARIDFEQLKWNPNNRPLNVAEITFYEPAWKVSVDGQLTPELADELQGDPIAIGMQKKIVIELGEPQLISGIAWNESLQGTQIRPSVKLDGRPAEGIKTDPNWRSLHFDAVEAQEVTLTFSGPSGETLPLAEIDLYQPIDREGAELVKISFPEEPIGERISPLVYGGNIEYWIDDDAVLSDPHFIEVVRDTPLTLLRFPGGTESDRYLWREHKLYDPTIWPEVDGPQTTDTDEFIRFCREVGAESMICVNTEYAFHENDIQLGAQYAADWVQYCKDKGYNVKYWTIGNEMYWRLSFTVEEYAELVIAYAEAMRAVDPDIIIAVPGEIDLDSVGKKDKPTDEGLAKMMEVQRLQNEKKITPKERVTRHNKLMQEYRDPNPPLWWPTLLERVGKHIDMIEVHVYAGDAEKAFISDEGYAKELRDLKAFAEELMGKDLLLAVTEYNNSIWWADGKDAVGMEQALFIGEILGRLIEGGTDLATFWPITMQGQWIAKALYVEKSHDFLPSYYTFSAMARHLRGNRLPVVADNPSVYAIAAIDADSATLIVMARPTRIKGPVTLQIPTGDGPLAGMAPVGAQVISAPERRSYEMTTSYPAWDEVEESHLELTVPQHAFSLIKFIRP